MPVAREAHLGERDDLHARADGLRHEVSDASEVVRLVARGVLKLDRRDADVAHACSLLVVACPKASRRATSDERRHRRPGATYGLGERVTSASMRSGEVEPRPDGASDQGVRAERPRRLPRAGGDVANGRLTGAVDGAEPVELERSAGRSTRTVRGDRPRRSARPRPCPPDASDCACRRAAGSRSS